MSASTQVRCGCGTVLARGNTSGKCKACFMTALNAGLTSEKRGALMRRAMMRDPALKKFHADRLRAYHETSAFRDAARARLLAHPKHHLANAASPAGSESRLRAGRTRSAQRLAHIPEEARAGYMAMRKKGVPRDLAQQAALAEHEQRLDAFRRLIGAATAGAPA